MTGDYRLKVFEAPPTAPGDVIIVVDDVDEYEKVVFNADELVDVNLEKGYIHLLYDDVIVTVTMKRDSESYIDAAARASFGVPPVIEITEDVLALRGSAREED